MARNKEMFMPQSADDKAQVLGKLQGRPHFEKILTWTSTPRPKGSCRLLMPAWFVQKHSDKVGEFVILRTETSTKAWPVTLEISVLSPKSSSVRFAIGWKAFAASHGLLEGDSLVFALTAAMSEFEVYVFRRCTNNRNAAANGKENAKEKMTVIAEKKLDSLQTGMRKHIPCPSFFKRLTTTNAELIDGARRQETKEIMPLSTDDKAQVLHKLQGRSYFEKILTRSSIPMLFRGNPHWKRKCRMAVPAWFVREHGDKFQQSVILRTETSTKDWPVTLEVVLKSPTSASVRFSGGWRAFAVSNRLLEGDSLVFALTAAMSEFEVYIFRSSTADRIRIASNAKEKLDSLRVDITKQLPTFLRSLTSTDLTHALEIPLGFMKIHGSRIHSVVKLQGMHEQSPVQSMNCRITRGRPVRYFIRADWRVFAAENHLQVGEELLFTLASDSLFVVRRAAPQAPS